MLRLRYIFLCLLLSITAVCLGAPTTEGTEFWTTFLNNEDTYEGSYELHLTLIASSRENATVTVQNPQTGWQSSFVVSANQVAQMEIPHKQCYTYNHGVVSKRGLKITSTAPISLYASNFREYTYDATIVLPATALGKDYIVQIYENELFAKEFAVVATADNTLITITPHSRTRDGHVKNVPYTITLNAGETYQVMSDDSGSDFSGSRIKSSQPIAVFAGHQCINVPTGNPWCDHIVEQQMPTQMWGKQFALTKTGSMNSDCFMITAREDGTVVKISGTVVATLKALESYTYRLGGKSAFVETSQPATCFLYIEGARDNNMTGDPSSVHVSPVEQRISELTFATFQTQVSRTHYVNIVTTAAGAAGMMLDGRNISGVFQTLSGNPSLRFAQVNISHGTHTLRTNADGFTGHVYGLGHCESYAYTFGSATLILDGSILVDGEPHADIVYTEERCYKAPIHFSARTNTDYTSIHWDLGDGTTSTDDEVTHTFPAPGQYTITMAIANEDGNDTARTTLTLYETVHDTVYAAICEDEKYTINGQTYTTEGKYDIHLVSQAGCDSLVTLFLTVNKKQLTIVDAEFNRGSSYRWHDRWYRNEGIYKDTLVSAAGCDSVVELHLVEVDPTQITCDTLCWQAYYPFHGYDFPLPSIEGFEDQQYINYTLAYTDKVNCVTYKTNLAIIPKDGNGVYEIHDTIQYGQTYEWLGESLTEEGTYYKVMGGGSECRQEYTLYLTVLPFPITATERTLCHTDTVVWRGAVYDTPGIYTDTAYTLLGIEGIYRLTLTDNRSVTELSVNNVEEYNFNGTLFTASGTYYDTIPNSTGCDSVIILHLGIHEPCEIRVEENRSLCDGEQLNWNNMICEPGNDYSKSFVSAGGCDSIVTLHISKLEKKQTELNVSICEGEYYRVGDTRFSEQGEYTIPLKTAEGCDSIVTLHLSLKQSYADTLTHTINIGESYSWQNVKYSKQGIYSAGYIAQNGCDSICVLRLKVDKDCLAARDTSATICFDETLTWYGEQYDASGEYTHLLHFEDKCDTLVTLHLTVLPKAESHEDMFVFTGSVYTWHNHTYDASGIYEYHTSSVHGCDSTVYLHLTVSDKPVFDSIETAALCEGESYPWHEQILSPQEGHTVFTHTLQGSDVDTLITLTFTIFPRYDDISFSHSMCAGETFTWENIEYTEEGDYTRRFETVHGCDSLVTLHLRLYPKYDDVIDEQEICEGGSYAWQGVTYSSPVEITRTLQTIHGCDSVVTFRLILHPQKETTDDPVTRCYGETYTWNGQEYSESGTYTQTLTTVYGCDSVVHFTLTVLPQSGSEETVYICAGEKHTWEGMDYTEEGDYTRSFTNSKGCDSLVTLHLRLYPRYDDISFSHSMCAGETFTWENIEYTEEGDYTRRFETVHGCDSLVTLHLRLYPKYDDVIDEQTRYKGESCTWQGETYTGDVTVTRTLQTIHGCDSVVTLILHFNDKPVEQREVQADICEGETYRFYEEEFTSATEYTTMRYGQDADTLVTLHLSVWPTYSGDEQTQYICPQETFIWNENNYTEQGDYTVTLSSVHGCDSVVTLHLRHYPAYDTIIYDTALVGYPYYYEEKKFNTTGIYQWSKPTIHGCDSSFTLHLEYNEVVLDALEDIEVCPEDGVVKIYISYSGVADSVRITLADAPNTIYDTVIPVPQDGILTIPLAGNPGKTEYRIMLLFQGKAADGQTAVLQVNYPSSVLEQAWNDVIAVLADNYNGGHHFIAFQWYENGVMLPGETKSYLYKPLVMGAEYSAMLTEVTANGPITMMTCPLIAQPQTDISLYPTVAGPNQMIFYRSAEKAQIILYNALGRIVSGYELNPGEDSFYAPATAGVYTAKVMLHSGAERIYKLIIQ